MRLLHLLLVTTVVMFTTVCAASAQEVPAEGNYTGKGRGLRLSFKLTRGTASDSLSGNLSGIPVNGFYEVLTDSVVLFFTDGGGKKRVIRGIYNPALGIFELRLKFPGGTPLDFKVRPGGKVDRPLTGIWHVNDSSFFLVSLEENRSASILGDGLKGFKGYRLTGQHVDDNLILIQFISPDGTDNSNYTLRLCASGKSMVGTTNSTIVPVSVWCRKEKGRHPEGLCEEDPSC